MNAAQLADAMRALPEEQRVALAHQAIMGLSDPNCALSMRRLATTARITADDMARQMFLRDCG